MMGYFFKGRRNVTVTAAASGDRGERRGRIKRGGGGGGYIAVMVLDIGALEYITCYLASITM